MTRSFPPAGGRTEETKRAAWR